MKAIAHAWSIVAPWVDRGEYPDDLYFLFRLAIFQRDYVRGGSIVDKLYEERSPSYRFYTKAKYGFITDVTSYTS